MIRNAQTNQKCPNYQGHFIADSKSRFLDQEMKVRNIEVGNNTRSWASAPNNKGIGGGKEGMFLGEDGRITRAVR